MRYFFWDCLAAGSIFFFLVNAKPSEFPCASKMEGRETWLAAPSSNLCYPLPSCLALWSPFCLFWVIKPRFLSASQHALISHTESNAKHRKQSETTEDLYAKVTLNIWDILTLAPANSADQSSQQDFGETPPLRGSCEIGKLRNLLWAWPSECQGWAAATVCPLRRGFVFLLHLLSTADEVSWRLDLPRALLLLFLSLHQEGQPMRTYLPFISKQLFRASLMVLGVFSLCCCAMSCLRAFSSENLG